MILNRQDLNHYISEDMIANKLVKPEKMINWGGKLSPENQIKQIIEIPLLSEEVRVLHKYKQHPT